MLAYIGKRLMQLIPLWIAITILIFVVIQLPKGDYITLHIENLRQSGSEIDEAQAEMLRKQYNLDKPLYHQYFIWMRGIVTKGYLGESFVQKRSVNEILGERITMTIILSIVTLLFTWIVSIPIGIYSATHQYSKADYFFTMVGFIGISVPAFLVAIIIIYRYFIITGIAYSGLFSPDYINQPWDINKFRDLLSRIWLPVVVIGLTGTAGMIRTVRGLMLDELNKQYVITARAKGLSEWKMLLKYPIRVAMNPIISTIGWILPGIFAGEALVSIVLNLQTIGPIALGALQVQDMYLAASYLLIASTLTIVGTLISDVLLVVIDPRIKFGAVTD